MRNIRLLIQYDGTRYRGWQRQTSSSQTIQGKIEQVLTRMSGEEVRIDGAGRTDAGVHAKAQVANFHLNHCDMSVNEILIYLNQYLPEDIRITSVVEAGPRFHSRFNVTGKTYRYLCIKKEHYDVFNRDFAWGLTTEIDVPAMREAAKHFLGKHDFYGFCTKASKKKSTVRTIKEIRIEETDATISFFFEGDGFLYNMVRILTGTLIEVGSGERKASDIPA